MRRATPMSPHLEGRVALITGASSGIGEACARALAMQGCHLVLGARRIDRLQALADDLRAQGAPGGILATALDVTDAPSVHEAVGSALQRFEKIDLLVNSAGFGKMDSLDRLDLQDDILPQVETNLLGVIRVTAAVIPGMLERGSGHIIQIGSLAAFLGTPHYSIYAATKFGLRGFSQALRREVAPRGIHVSVVYPGGVRTDFARDPSPSRRRLPTTPRGLVLTPEAVARAVVRLALRPRRSLILPGIMAPIVWANMLAPGLVDGLIVWFLSRRQRPRREES